MSRRPARFLTALLALSALPLSGRAIAEEAPAPEAPPPIVESVTPSGYRVRVPIGPATVERGRVFGFDLAAITIPQGAVDRPAGEPALPTRVVLLRVPWGTTPVANASRVGRRALGVLVPTPFQGLLDNEAVRRRITPRALTEALGAMPYRALGDEPEPPVVARAVPMAAGEERYLAVTLRPVTWNPSTREAGAADEILLDISWERPVPAFASGPEADAAAFRAGAGRRSLSLGSSFAVGPRYAARPRSGSAARAGVSPAALGPLRLDPSRPWVRLSLIRSGLYRVTASDLASVGVATSGIDPATFRLFRSNPGDLPESVDVDTGPDSLRECSIVVTGEGDGSFDSGDTLYFYGTGETGFGYDLRAGGGVEYEEMQRTDQEPLWLTWGPGLTASPPRRMAVRDAAPITVGAPLLTAVTHRLHFEENRFPAFDLFRAPLRWERWFMRLISDGTRLPFSLALPGAVPGGEASVRVRMWGSGASAGALHDHVTRIRWDGAVVDTAGWDFTNPQDLAAAGLRTNGSRDTLEIEIPKLIEPFPPGDPNRADIQYLAWFEVAYPRSLVASADTLNFAALDSVPPERVQYTITAVSDTTAAWLLDRADPENPARLIGGQWTGSAPAFTWTVEDSVGAGYRPRYSLVSTVRAARPSISLYAPPAGPHVLGDLLDPSNEADYLVIAPPTFLAAAESLAADRSVRLSGFASPRAAIATTDRVYAQLSGGQPDPVAIRNLLAYATRHWTVPPLYVCLLGDASEDPKNFSGFATPDWVPTYGENFDTDIFLGAQFITDDFFAFLDGPGDRIFDVALGRLPAHDPADALALVRGKRATFERAADFDWWRARALLSADDGWKWSVPGTKLDVVGADHVQELEQMDDFHLPFPVRREKVYLNDYPFADSTKTSKPKAREAFIPAVNAGNWLAEYVGHGNENFLADEQIFRSSDLGRLTNAARPSIFGFFSCAVGRFDDNIQEGLAEQLLRSPNGGAVTLAASHEVFGDQSSDLNNAFIDELFPAAPRADTLRTAGLAWARAKSAPQNQNPVARKYAYLGDPAVLPPLPRGRGVWEKAPLDSLARGELAMIRGHALNPDGSTDTLSTGTVLLEAMGPRSRRIELAMSDGNLIAVPYLLPGPLLYRGETTLNQGSFELRFVVPTDGRVIGGGAQIRALLSAAGGNGVGLAADSIRIGSSLSARVDQTPPTIRLRGRVGVDSSVTSGSQLTFEIEDSSGVDLTQFDNAHSIFVIVDDRGTPIDLTPTFKYEPSSYTRGTAILTLPQLASGAHLLEVHASDTYRNVGVATFTIDLTAGTGSGGALLLTEVFNYPNPFPRETYLHARLSRAARLRVQILTVSGRRVRDFAVDGKTGENYIPWDGRDSEGEKVAIGVYLFKLTAEASGGSRVTAVARALRAE